MKGARRTRKPRLDSGFADLMSPSSPPPAPPGVITGLGLSSPRATPKPFATSSRSSRSACSASSPPPADDDWGDLLATPPRRRLSPQKPIIEAPAEHRRASRSESFSLHPASPPAPVSPAKPPAKPPAPPSQAAKPTPKAAFAPASFAPVLPAPDSTSSAIPAFLSGWDGADGWGDDLALDDSDPDAVDDDAWGAWSDPEVEPEPPATDVENASENWDAHQEPELQTPPQETSPDKSAVGETPPLPAAKVLTPPALTPAQTADSEATKGQLGVAEPSFDESAFAEDVSNAIDADAFDAWDETVGPAQTEFDAVDEEPSDEHPATEAPLPENFEATVNVSDSPERAAESASLAVPEPMQTAAVEELKDSSSTGLDAKPVQNETTEPFHPDTGAVETEAHHTESDGSAWGAWDVDVPAAFDDSVTVKEEPVEQPSLQSASVDEPALLQETVNVIDSSSGLGDCGTTDVNSPSVGTELKTNPVEVEDSAFAAEPLKKDPATAGWGASDGCTPSAVKETVSVEIQPCSQLKLEKESEPERISISKSEEVQESAEAWGAWDGQTPATAEEAAPTEAAILSELPEWEQKELDGKVLVVAPELERAANVEKGAVHGDACMPAAAELSRSVDRQPVDQTSSEAPAFDESAFLAASEEIESDAYAWDAWDTDAPAAVTEKGSSEVESADQPADGAEQVDETVIPAILSEVESRQEARDDCDMKVPASASVNVSAETQSAEHPTAVAEQLDERFFVSASNDVRKDEKKTCGGLGIKTPVHTKEVLTVERHSMAETTRFDENPLMVVAEDVGKEEVAWDGWDTEAPTDADGTTALKVEATERLASERKPLAESSVPREAEELGSAAGIWGGWNEGAPSASEQAWSAELKPEENFIVNAERCEERQLGVEWKAAESVKAAGGTLNGSVSRWDGISPGQERKEASSKEAGACEDGATEEWKMVRNSFDTDASAIEPPVDSFTSDAWGGWDEAVSTPVAKVEALSSRGQLPGQTTDRSTGSMSMRAEAPVNSSNSKENISLVISNPMQEALGESQTAGVFSDVLKTEDAGPETFEANDDRVVSLNQQMLAAEKGASAPTAAPLRPFDEIAVECEPLTEKVVDAWGAWDEVDAPETGQRATADLPVSSVTFPRSDSVLRSEDGMKVAQSGIPRDNDLHTVGWLFTNQEQQSGLSTAGSESLEGIGGRVPVDGAVPRSPRRATDLPNSGEKDPVQPFLPAGDKYRTVFRDEDGWSSEVRSTDVDISSTVAGTDVPSVAAPSSVDDSDWEAGQQSSWDPFPQRKASADQSSTMQAEDGQEMAVGIQNGEAYSAHSDQAFDTVRNEFPSAGEVGQIVPSGTESWKPHDDSALRQSEDSNPPNESGQLGNEPSKLDKGNTSSCANPVKPCELSSSSPAEPAEPDGGALDGVWGSQTFQNDVQSTVLYGSGYATRKDPITAAPFPSGNANNYWTEKLQFSSQDENQAWASVEVASSGMQADARLLDREAGPGHETGNMRGQQEAAEMNVDLGRGGKEQRTAEEREHVSLVAHRGNAEYDPFAPSGSGDHAVSGKDNSFVELGQVSHSLQEGDAPDDPFAPSETPETIHAFSVEETNVGEQGRLLNPSAADQHWNVDEKSTLGVLKENSQDRDSLGSRQVGRGNMALDRAGERDEITNSFAHQQRGAEAVEVEAPHTSAEFSGWSTTGTEVTSPIPGSHEDAWHHDSSHSQGCEGYPSQKNTENGSMSGTSDSLSMYAPKHFAPSIPKLTHTTRVPPAPAQVESYDPFAPSQVVSGEPLQEQPQVQWINSQNAREALNFGTSFTQQRGSFETGERAPEQGNHSGLKPSLGMPLAPETAGSASSLNESSNVGEQVLDSNFFPKEVRPNSEVYKNGSAVEGGDVGAESWDFPQSKSEETFSASGVDDAPVVTHTGRVNVDSGFEGYAPRSSGPSLVSEGDGLSNYAPRTAPSSVSESDGLSRFAPQSAQQLSSYEFQRSGHDADPANGINRETDGVSQPQAYAPSVGRNVSVALPSEIPPPPIYQATHGHIEPFGVKEIHVEESSVNIFSATDNALTDGAFPQPPQPPQLFQPHIANTSYANTLVPSAVPAMNMYAPKPDLQGRSQYVPVGSLTERDNRNESIRADNLSFDAGSNAWDVAPQDSRSFMQGGSSSAAYVPNQAPNGVAAAVRGDDSASMAGFVDFSQGAKPEYVRGPLDTPSFVPAEPYTAAAPQSDSGATLDPSIYSYPFSIMDATAPGELDYRPPRPVFSWGFGGSMLTVLPYGNGPSPSEGEDVKGDVGMTSSIVRLHDLSGVCQDGSNDDWIAASEALGPLRFPVSHPDLLPYADMCERLSRCSAGLKGSDAESRATLWRVLAHMCRHSSSDWRTSADSAISGPSSIPMFERNDSSSFLSGRTVRESPLKLSSVSSRRSDVEQCDAAAEVERLVTQGQGAEAIRVAQDAGLWPLALVLAATLDKALYLSAVTEFAKSSLNDGSALQTLFFSMAENDAEIIRKATSVSGLNEWRKTVGMLLTSRRSAIHSDHRRGDRFLQLIGQVGDALVSQRGDVVAGHVCYLISGRITSLDASSIALLGGDMERPGGGPRPCGSAAVVLQSLVYEAIVNAQTGESFPHLLPFKLLLTEEISAVGRSDIALHHCESLTTSVRGIFDSGRSDLAARVLTPPFLASLESLEQRVRGHLGMQESTEKLGKLSALGRSLTSVFSRSAADLKPEPSAVSAVHQPSNPDKVRGSSSLPEPLPQQIGYSQPTGFSQEMKYSQPFENSQMMGRAQQPGYGAAPQRHVREAGQSVPVIRQGPGISGLQLGATGAAPGGGGVDNEKKEESGSRRWNEFVSKTIGVLAPAEGDLSPPPRSRVGQTFPTQIQEAPAIGLGPGTGSRAPGQELQTTHMRSQSMGDMPMGMFNSSAPNTVPKGYSQYAPDSRPASTSELSSTPGIEQNAGLRNFNGVVVQERTSASSDSNIAHRRTGSDMTVASQTSEKRPPRPPRRSTPASASTSALDAAGEKKAPVTKGWWRSRFSEKIMSAFRGPPRAHLGSDNKFVFDKERGRWVIEGEELEEEEDVPPPPPDDDSTFVDQGNEVSSTASYENLRQVGYEHQPLPRSHSLQDSRSDQVMCSQHHSTRPMSHSVSHSPMIQTASTGSFKPSGPSNQDSLLNASHPGIPDNMNVGANHSEGSATSSASFSTPMGFSASRSSSPAIPVTSGNKFRANTGRRSGRRAYVDTFNNGAAAPSRMQAPIPGRPAAPGIAGLGLGGGSGVKIFTPSATPTATTDDSARDSSGGMGVASTASSFHSSEQAMNQNAAGPPSTTTSSQPLQYDPPIPAGPGLGQPQPQYVPRSPSGPRMMA